MNTRASCSRPARSKAPSRARAVTACTRAIRAVSCAPAARGADACTGCIASSQAATPRAPHPPPRGSGPPPLRRGVGCHMPRVVYGVLDLHGSRPHRGAQSGARRRRRAPRRVHGLSCLRHARGGRRGAGAAVGWGGAGASRVPDAPSPAARSLFAGDPVSRSVAADALGRARRCRCRPRRARDARGRAARSHGQRRVPRRPPPRVARPRTAGSHTLPALARLRPQRTTVPPDRRAAVERVRASLPPASVAAPDPVRVRRLRDAAAAVAIDIGE